jgi:hypothetical protein
MACMATLYFLRTELKRSGVHSVTSLVTSNKIGYLPYACIVAVVFCSSGEKREYVGLVVEAYIP